MKYVINKKTFNTKKSIKEYYREILYRNIDSVLSTFDKEAVMSLLSYHTDVDQKIGSGIEDIKVEYHIDTYSHTNTYSGKHPHFQLYRTDGSNIDFSFIKCINAINNETYKITKCITDTKDAFRNSIAEQVIAFRYKSYSKSSGYICEKTKEVFRYSEEVHVDHYPITFDKIVYDFMHLNGYKFEDIEIDDTDGIYGVIKDSNILESWCVYHKEVAHLRIISSNANLTGKKHKSLNFKQFI